MFTPLSASVFLKYSKKSAVLKIAISPNLQKLEAVTDIHINSEGPEARIPKNWCFLKRKVFDLVFPIFLPKSSWSLKKKKKKRFSLWIDLVFPYSSPNFIVISQKRSSDEFVLRFPTFSNNFIVIFKKNLQQNKTICIIFKKGAPKNEGGPRQLPHSPHPISTTG